MRRFALLSHRRGDHVHWDLLITYPRRARLATWRLAENPCGRAARARRAIATLRIADHRLIYLAYEGRLSRNRGSVRQVDRGELTVTRRSRRGLLLRFAGLRLRGEFELKPATGSGVLRQVRPGR